MLSIGRGLSQGKLAAFVSGTSSGIGILLHVFGATLGLTLLLQSSTFAFYIVKFIGAAYLIWLGVKVLRFGNLFCLEKATKQPLKNIFVAGFLSAALNPKPGLFVLSFVPQFVNPELGSVTTQMLVYGAWFAFITVIGFTSMGLFASHISSWMINSPKVVKTMNTSAGLTFICSGLTVAALKQ
jgi:threonine/homoserine/homoserine lactone efflux protein